MRVLLFAPMFYGHPVVYCRVYSKILLVHGCTVVLASFGLASFSLDSWPEVAEIAESRFEVADLGGVISPAAGPLTAEELIAVQKAHKIDVTVFMHADYFRDQFLRIAEGAAPALHGRNVGIFSLTARWFPGEDNVTGKPVSWIAPTLRTSLGNLKRKVFDYKKSDAYFFEHALIGRRVLDTLLVKDERVSRAFASPVHWMPEIYKVFDEQITDKGRKQFEAVSERYESFRKQSADKEVLLYFGNAAWYKGYDYALALALRDPSVAFVHCGAPDLGDGKYEFDLVAMKAELQAQGRFFETAEFLDSQELIEYFFASARRVVSTHRLAGTSGTMLQAVECGKPLLTPDSGLLGWRTKTYKLGSTYAHGDLDDMSRKWREFDPERFDFRPSLAAFIARFSQEKLEQCVCAHVLEQAETPA
jgi:glycosyltransferase involved in cell wall biosynthesis